MRRLVAREPRRFDVLRRAGVLAHELREPLQLRLVVLQPDAPQLLCLARDRHLFLAGAGQEQVQLGGVALEVRLGGQQAGPVLPVIEHGDQATAFDLVPLAHRHLEDLAGDGGAHPVLGDRDDPAGTHDLVAPGQEQDPDHSGEQQQPKRPFEEGAQHVEAGLCEVGSR